MKRIEEAAATVLEHARFYLARLPLDTQTFRYDEPTGQLVNDAIPLLFHCECAIRMENSQY